MQLFEETENLHLEILLLLHLKFNSKTRLVNFCDLQLLTE